MKIIIGSHDISDITISPKLTQSCLAENEAITLSGRRQVDRFGDFKTNLSFTVGKVKYSRWQTISELLKELPVDVTVTTNSEGKTYQMCLDEELPTVYIFNDHGTDYCANIPVTLKEVG